MGKEQDREKSKQAEQFWLSAKLARRRFIASQALRSGKLEQLRKQAIEEGDTNWRILRYARVVDPKRIPIPVHYGSYVTPKTFEKHLRFLRDNCHPIALGELLSLLVQNKPVPDKAVAITFDGGHMDSYVYAFPSLVNHQIPATFFIPTTYIGSKSFFFSDRIYMALRFMQKAQMPLLDLTFLDAEFREELKKVAPNWEITDESIPLYLRALDRGTHRNRIVTLEVFGTLLKDIFSLPDYEDFVTWDDIERMKQHGMSFGPASNGNHLATQMTAQAFIDDFSLAFKLFKEHNIPLERTFSFREGVTTPEALAMLAKVGLKYALTIGSVPSPAEQTDLPIVLGRVRMAEEDSFCAELFACKMWGVKISGIQY